MAGKFHCKICSPSAPVTHYLKINEYQIEKCDKCSHLFVELNEDTANTDNIFKDDYFEGGKDGYPDYLKEKEILIERGKKYGNILNKYTKPGRLLDVGSAAGFILQGFIETGWQGVGIEPNDKMANFAREQMNLEVYTSAVERFEYKKMFDAVSIIQVIASFRELIKGLEVLSKHTKEGGYWLVETYDKNSITAKLMGKFWHEYCPPSVIHWFSPKTIKHFFSQFGFSHVATGRLPKKIKAEHAKSLLAYKATEGMAGKMISTAFKVVPDNMTLLYPSEDLFWALFQKTQ